MPIFSLGLPHADPSSGRGGLIVHVGAGGRGIFHAAGIQAKNLAQLGVIGRQRGLTFLLGSKFRPLLHVVQMGQ